MRKNAGGWISFIVLSFCAFIFFLSLPSFAVTVESEKLNESKYDASYFAVITGEVFGQTAPGIESVKVNGIAIPIKKDLTFKTQVTLKEGEKYLTVESKYGGIRFIKKYLVVRHPKAQKTFKVNLPEKEFVKIIEEEKKIAQEVKKAKAQKRPVRIVRKKTTPVAAAPPTLKPVAGIPKAEVSIAAEPALAEVKEPKNGRFGNFIKMIAERFAGRKITTGEAAMVMGKETEKVLKQEAVLIVEKRAQRIIEGEVKKYIEEKVPAPELKNIVRSEARDLLEEKYPDAEILKLLKEEAPKVLKKEVELILDRDIPSGEGLRLVRKEIQEITRREAPKVIEQEARKAVQGKFPTAEVTRILKEILDRELLANIAKNVVREEMRAYLNQEAARIIKSEVARILEEKKDLLRAKPLKILPSTGQWAGYDLVIELAPGKLLLIKREKKNYIGYLYSMDKRLWIPLKDISYDEFKELLEKGTIPPSFNIESKL